jgi:hypothetical protein
LTVEPLPAAPGPPRQAFPQFDPDDVASNPSGNRAFQDVASQALSRRSLIRAGGMLAAVGFLGAVTDAAPARGGPRPLLGFTPVPVGTADVIVVPEGYTAEVLIPWGQPLRSTGPRWRPDASNTAAEQAEQIGSHHDGMHFFPLSQRSRHGDRGVLVVNHEYLDGVLLYPDGVDVMTEEKVRKGLAAQGMSVVEVALVDGRWRAVDSRLNRRITGSTPVAFSGPVTAEHPALRTGQPPAGTFNNCSHGVTPWGTYLSCEENFNGYFGTDDPTWQPSTEQARYGLNSHGFGYRWHEADPRFDLAGNPNEPHRFGWVVEIDPFDPRSTPVKRTALGRIKHEGATVVESRGRVVVYTADDQDGDYVYKFVGNTPWRQAVRAGRSPLDDGTLYVARFDADGTGRWLPLRFGVAPLTPEHGWADQADVLLRTRQAADTLQATPLDRPEWITVHPRSREVYLTLSNGSGWAPTAGRQPNPYGHIIRWAEAAHDHTATSFSWEVFLLAGDPGRDPDLPLPPDSGFGAPDGLSFDLAGRLWIQTDLPRAPHDPADPYGDLGNNAMLAADPETGEVRRFMVGPRGCEITGAVTTPDQRTMFVSIQHPGEASVALGVPTPDNPRRVSNWPDFHPAGRPRSATVAIYRRDGGVIGT